MKIAIFALQDALMNYRRVAGQGNQAVFRVFLSSDWWIVREVPRIVPKSVPSQWFSNQGFTQHGFRSVKAAVRTSLTLIVGPKLASVKGEFEAEWPNIWRKA